ncbi:ArsR/SmtB family transcription factor [Kineococcus gynurae]|uniref:ArsR/SmtB family transcription factor n=1 Tax=Kineococcus gynurae TaxID=452979 RepID=A0ABV5LSX4_9ACTN
MVDDARRTVARDALDASGPRLPEVLDRLSAFSDPTRLGLLIAIHAAPGAPVSDLAAAAGLSPNTATQALQTLRAAGLVRRVREGRFSRWYLSDEAAHDLLHHLGAPHSDLHPAH